MCAFIVANKWNNNVNMKNDSSSTRKSILYSRYKYRYIKPACISIYYFYWYWYLYLYLYFLCQSGSRQQFRGTKKSKKKNRVKAGEFNCNSVRIDSDNQLFVARAFRYVHWVTGSAIQRENRDVRTSDRRPEHLAVVQLNNNTRRRTVVVAYRHFFLLGQFVLFSPRISRRLKR